MSSAKKTKKSKRKSNTGAPAARRTLSPTALVIVGVSAFAFLYRLAAILVLRSLPYIRTPIVDAHEYHTRALQIASGIFIPDRIPTDPPFYPWLLAPFYAAFGGAPITALVLNALLAALTAPALYLLGKQLGGKRAGIIAAIGGALYLPLVLFSVEILTPTLMVFISAWALYLIINIVGPRTAGAAGVIIGLAALTRANALFFIPFFGGWLLYRFRDRPAAYRLRLAGASAIGFLIIVSPQVIINNIIEPGAVMIQDYGGLNLYLGVEPSTNGLALSHPGPTSVLLIDAPKHEGIFPAADRNAWFVKKAIGIAVDNPFETLKLIIPKTVFAVNNFEYGTGVDQRWLEGKHLMFRLNPLRWVIVFPLALVGLLSFLRRSDKTASLAIIAGWGGAIILSLIMLTVASRYRAPALAAILPLAAIGVENIYSIAVARDYRSISIGAAVLIIGLVVSAPNWFGYRELAAADENIAAAEAYRNAGDFRAAADYVNRRLAANPNDWDSRYLRGFYLLNSNRPKEALADFLVVAEKVPRFTRVYHEIASALLKLGDRGRALEAYDRGLSINPKDYILQGESANLLAAAGRYPEALSRARAAAEIHQTPELSVNLARLEMIAGNNQRAFEALDFARDKAPETSAAGSAARRLAEQWKNRR